MCITRPWSSGRWLRPSLLTFIAAGTLLLLPPAAAAQGLTGELIGTVRDAQGGVLSGAAVRVSSPALIGGSVATTTNEKGQLRFPALPPGPYVLDIEMKGFAPLHEEGIEVGAGESIVRTGVLQLEGVAESVTVEGTGSRIDARNPGFGTRFGAEDLTGIPTRRSSMFDSIRAAPGVSPTSPASGTATTVSAFGSGTNENQFLVDGTNFTCPCTGVARAEPSLDSIQEVHVQSVGASAEYGNVQGAVINVVMRQGSERFRYDASYYWQTARLTSRPVQFPLSAPQIGATGYTRARYRDMTTNLGGPLRRDRLWFFAGYQYLRDYDSQPGTEPGSPRTYEQDKLFAKLTWKLTQGLQLQQSFNNEFGINPDRPTFVTPAESIAKPEGSAPAMTYGHLTHTLSPNTVWDLRAGRFVFSRDNGPSSGDPTAPNRFDRATGVTSGAPPRLGSLTIERTTTKATLTHYRPGLLGADHQWKIGGQFERAAHGSTGRIPTGVRFVDNNGAPFQAITSAPSNIGGAFVTAAGFASDAITIGDQLTINAGVRFDHSRAISQNLRAVDAQGSETDEVVRGRGTLYTWNLWSPRLGLTARLSADGRTMLRASYGRFSPGVLTGELEPFHPGATSTTTSAFVPA
ncbi:MAG: TonB-dependent receptor, partial [Acidobacteriota bacterium]|nr:TonB-dependent receptor [Acidobacteriota bacterium]